MANLTKRNIEILKIIVEEFLETWEVLWSKSLLKKYDLGVSSATVRNDMAFLESLELIYQPYNSAGRLPTSKWLRAFINYLMEQTPNHLLDHKDHKMPTQDIKTLEDFIYNITNELATKTWDISFFVSPHHSINQYSWISHFLKNNYKMLGDNLFLVIEMMEDKHNFINFISSLPLSGWINVFIWEENVIQFLKDYTIMVRPLRIDDEVGFLGIIWWLKMDYSFNISALRWIIA